MYKDVNKQSVLDVEDFIQEHFDLLQYLKTSNLLDDYSVDYSGNIKMKCPFHVDNTPSLFVNIKTGKYNCFSCTFGGSKKAGFMYEIDKKIKESFTGSYYSYLDKLVKDNPQLQIMLGSRTIFQKRNTRLEDIDFSGLTQINSFKVKKMTPTTWRSLSKSFQSTDVSIKLKSIMLMQDDFTPAQIYDSLLAQPSKVQHNSDVVDISSLLE